MARLVVFILGILAGGCGLQGAPLSNLGFEITCGDGQGACNWEVVEGTASFGATWNPADPGLDLSVAGRAVVQQKTVFETPGARDYVLEATTLREAGVDLGFELHWYRPGPTPGGFWDGNPELLRTDLLGVTEEGLARVTRLTSIPSEARGLILRIIKGGSGRCWVDEIRYHPVPESSSSR